jgi:hypothetical protein
MSAKKISLSKSTLIRSMQCAKSLYLYKNNYTLRDKAGVTQQQRFDRGHRVGKLAHELFPNGKDCTPPDHFSYNESIAATKLLVQQQYPVIYEASFKYNGILAALDILENRDGKHYAYEVKSSLRISNTYLLDAAIQYYIITRSGTPLEDFFLVTINNDYVKDGELDVNAFFKKTSVMNEIQERIPFIEKSIDEAIATLSRAEEPSMDIGPHCTKPYPCDFQSYCWKNIEKESVWYLPGISMQEKAAFIASGINTVDAIENTDTLNGRQKVILEAFRNQQPYIEREKIRDIILQLEYPLYFFDVEAFQPAVPLFDGTQPYDRIPFLFSLHYKASETAAIEQISCISPVGADNRIDFIEQFLSATQQDGNILVFNALMEKGVLYKLASAFPEYKAAIYDRINRIIDMEIPFKELYYYHPAQQGSFSLKAVGNAILQRDEFMKSTVKDGEEAMAVYNELFYINDSKKIEENLEALKTYCRTDTYVLYEIFEQLKKLTKD